MSDRTFATHQIRRAVPVPTLWDFAALDTDAPVPARLPVPSAWELVPALHNYRGRAHYTTRIRCGGNIRLYFGGVSFRTRVLLDGNESPGTTARSPRLRQSCAACPTANMR